MSFFSIIGGVELELEHILFHQWSSFYCLFLSELGNWDLNCAEESSFGKGVWIRKVSGGYLLPFTFNVFFKKFPPFGKLSPLYFLYVGFLLSSLSPTSHVLLLMAAVEGSFLGGRFCKSWGRGWFVEVFHAKKLQVIPPLWIFYTLRGVPFYMYIEVSFPLLVPLECWDTSLAVTFGFSQQVIL